MLEWKVMAMLWDIPPDDEPPMSMPPISMLPWSWLIFVCEKWCWS